MFIEPKGSPPPRHMNIEFHSNQGILIKDYDKISQPFIFLLNKGND